MAYPIVVLFATVRFVDAVAPLALMCVASLPTAPGLAVGPTLLTLKKTKAASAITVITILLEAAFSFVSLKYMNLGLLGVALSRFFAALASLVLGAHLLRQFLKVEFDKKTAWKSAVASAAMVLSLFGLELLRSVAEPSSYQFLALRLRLFPVYAVAGVMVYFLALIALRAVSKQDIQLLQDYVPKRIRWIIDMFSRIVSVSK